MNFKKVLLSIFIVMLTSSGAVFAENFDEPPRLWALEETIPLGFDSFGIDIDTERSILYINGRSGDIVALNINNEYSVIKSNKIITCQPGDSFGDTVYMPEISALAEVDEAGGVIFLDTNLETLMPVDPESENPNLLEEIGFLPDPYSCTPVHYFRLAATMEEDVQFAITAGTTAWPPGRIRLLHLDRDKLTDDFSAQELQIESTTPYSVHWAAIAPDNSVAIVTSFNTSTPYVSPLLFYDLHLNAEAPETSTLGERTEVSAPYGMIDIIMDPDPANQRAFIATLNGIVELNWAEKVTNPIWSNVGEVRRLAFHQDTNSLAGVSKTSVKFIDPDTGQLFQNLEIPDADLLGYLVFSKDGNTLYVVDRAGYLHVLTRPPLNQCPKIEEVSYPIAPVPVGTQIETTATFIDPDQNDWTAVWDWGDSSTSSGTVIDHTVFGTHTYASAGIYVVSVTVSDEGCLDTGEVRYIVVYDPDGGFVTGGGWIDSPAGAYLPDPDLSGKATFGFVSKYKKGASVPTGNTEFQFKVAGLNFHSSSYDWLVVTGDDFARFKGTGTINGIGEYKFLIWAGDGEPDTFRIKIWEEDELGTETVIYDNGFEQAIGGGSIVVHTGK